MSYRIAIDTGGTFTDVVAIHESSGELFAIKTPSTPDDPSRGLLAGIDEVIQAVGADPAHVSQVLHGTTTATNAVLEHKFEGLGLIVTEGFRHIIEIARQSVPDGYGNSFFWVKPRRLVPLHLVREVRERMLHNGEVMTPLDEESVVAAARELMDQGVTRVAVCLLHSYANPGHEMQVGAILKRRFPALFVSLSCVVLPEYREYERAMTTLIDVMVKPYCETYLSHAQAQIEKRSGATPFLIMQSNGGIVTSEGASHKPVTMLVSGPAGGVLGAMHMARLAGRRNILTYDVGGTSTDVSLVHDLKPELTNYSMIENYPVKTPMIDIVTVGTGGGSLAWIDPYGSLKVGPQSAGADPGPICYGRGGTQPTVTDAAVVLGRLPDKFIGGGLLLDVAVAQRTYDELAVRLGISAEEAAAGVLEIAAANQVHGIRQVTTTRGREPADYAMVAFGGAGGLFADDVADFLGIRTVIIPPNPGNLSAFGLHISDIKRDYVKTLVRQQSSADPAEIEAAWRELEEQGKAEIDRQGLEAGGIDFVRSADLRYVGEGHEVMVDLPPGPEGASAFESICDDFHDVHDRIFGFQYRGRQDVEIVNLRVRAVGRVPRPDVGVIEEATGEAAPRERRPVYWRETGWIDCAIHARDALGAGTRIHGPAVVEEYGSTLVVRDGWRVDVDRYGNLVMEKSR